jgi:diguanylate cyclase (GGDEF)-like protein/PAS domain S-box-containing protein
MSTKRLTVLLLTLLISVWALGVVYFMHRVDTEHQNYTERQITDLNIAWTAVQHLQQKGKDAYFQTYIMKPDIIELLRQAQNPEQRQLARLQLYRKLYQVYQQVSLQGVHQFQFVLPNNHSLLRMHSVHRFGDDLSDLRVSFRLANQTLKPTFGFELGRVLPGFRSVYPIDYFGQHLGAVEFRNTFETLRKDIAFLDSSREYALILHPRVKQELFSDFKRFYGQSVFNQAWLEEDPMRELPNASPPLSDYAKEVGKKLSERQDVVEKMEQGESFAIALNHNGQTHVASFLSIKDIEDKTAAYLVALSPAPLLDGLNNDLVNNVSVITILIVLLAWMIFAVLRHREELRVAATAFNVQEGITITDSDGKILKVNQAFSRLTGYKSEEVIGKTPAILSSGRQDKQFYKVMWQTLKKNGSWQGEIWNRRKNGELYAEWLTITAVYDEKGRVTHYVGAFLDITQRKEDEEQIRKLAFYDPLTELPNRRLLTERLEHAMATSSRTLRYCAVLFIDLDNFKTLNDTKGHDLGDQLLLEVAARLKRHARESDTVARLGGDEFVVLYENLNKDEHKAMLEVEYMAEEIRDSLNKPYCLEDYEHYSSPSIGIALFCGHEISMDEVLKNADSAMYQAKNAGRNTIRLFDPDMQQALEQRLALEEDLRYALGHQQLELYFQPQMNDQNRVLGAEMLIRWHHPVRGLVSPAEFIPLAEESGLIIEMGDWIIEQACWRLAQWAQLKAYRNLTLSANISARQLRNSDFVQRVQHWVEHYQVKPGQLKLEITESMLLEDLEDTIEKMNRLKDLGILFAMDDFGTGYSSLSIIKRLPLDQLKIDQSFISDLHDQESNLVLTHTIIAMSQALNLHVIAEGVENEIQRETLKSLGCYDYQGYLFAKPMPYNDFKSFIESHS